MSARLPGVVVLLLSMACATVSKPGSRTRVDEGTERTERKPAPARDTGEDLPPLADPQLRAADELCVMRIAQDPSDPRGYMARGLIRHRGGDTAGAARMYGLAIKADARFAPAYVNQGALFLEQGKAQEALDVLQRGAAQAPEHAGIFANMAAALSTLSRHEEAAAAAETAVELDPEDSDLRRNQAAILFHADRLEEAEKVLKSAVADLPDEAADFLMRLHELYLEMQDLRRALRTLDRVSALEPDAPEPYLRKAAILGKLEDLNGVLLALAEGLKRAPEDEDLQQFFAAAMAIRLQQDLEEGLLRMRADPTDVDAYVMVARVFQMAQDFRGALEILAEGVQANPDSATLWMRIGIAELSLGREAEALAAYKRAMAVDKKAGVALNNSAYLMVTARDPSLRDAAEALELARRALALEPTNVAFMDTLAEIHLARGDFSEAHRVIQEALRLEPGDGQLLAQAQRIEKVMEENAKRRPKVPPPTPNSPRPRAEVRLPTEHPSSHGVLAPVGP